ncbi:hypothetical protein Rhopal_004896-T1 [Rhodotorula paludigena]|uniref:Endonuclease/exonuclease/phosphatase domain-containing protein n=1 Tax=Rhodotorula paludigena TaxID=86838 RepID=A0AAV5GQT2_9BASI|nr:hypothetical protein Rhopal_004896-T1 [Rhodotorula paludigena]
MPKDKAVKEALAHGKRTHTRPDKPHQLTVLTYNTWSSSPTHHPAQSRAILDLLSSSRADLIALQEVSAAFFARLCAEPFFRTGAGDWLVTTPDEYWRAAGPGAPADRRGKVGEEEACVVLLRRELVGRLSEVGVLRLERARDEGAKAAIALRLFDGDAERLRVVTSHFSSLPHNAPLRSRQYRSCLAWLDSPSSSMSSSSSHSTTTRLFLGDFNASTPAEFSPLTSPPHSLVDACPSAPSSSTAPSTSAQEASFRAPPTFGHLYPWVHPSSRKPRKPRRIDRVYYSSPPPSSRGSSHSSGWALRPAEGGEHAYEQLGGTEAVRGPQGKDRAGRAGKRWASDHEAVRVSFEWVPA